MTRRSDPRFDDGVPVRSDFRDRRAPARDGRRTLQLCAQVRRALELAFLGTCADPGLQDLQVLGVTPAPDASRLRARLLLDEGADPDDRRTRLHRARTILQDEVAGAIRRRKVPEPVFELSAGDDPLLENP